MNRGLTAVHADFIPQFLSGQAKRVVF